MDNPLTQARKASDMAAALQIPAGLISSSYLTGDANGEPYYIKCAANSNKLVVFLHTWGTTYTQVASFPEIGAIDRACIVSPNFNGPNNTPNALGSNDAIDRIATVISEAQYKTGLSRIYLVAASGGTIAAMNYMGKYPGKVHRASLWLPIHDLALMYSHTSDNGLKADMVSAIGAAPTGLSDPAYLARSPRSWLASAVGPTTVFINVGTNDTVTPKVHGESARDQLQARPDMTVTYREWTIGHQFDAAQRTEAVKQLVLE